jgi:hypothetical protein
MSGFPATKQQPELDFYNQRGVTQFDQMNGNEANQVGEDEEMEIEPMSTGNAGAGIPQPFTYGRIQKMLKSHKWNQRA